MRLKSSSVIGGVVGVGEPAWWLAWDVDFCRRVRALGEDVGEECAERFEVAKWVRFSELSECAFDVVQLAFNNGLEEFFDLLGDLVWCSFCPGHTSSFSIHPYLILSPLSSLPLPW